MRGNATDLSRKTLLAGAAWLLLAASPALAQDSGTWSLPAPTGQPSAQGPVDPLNPVVRPTTSAPATSAPTPAPTSVPTIVAPPPPAPTATAAPSRQTQTPVAPTRRPAPSAAEQAPATPAASPDTATVSTPASTPAPSDALPASGEPAAESTPATQQGAGFDLWWLALPVVLLVLGAFAWLRRRRPSEEPAEWETDEGGVADIVPEQPVPATPAPALAIPRPAFAEKAPPPPAATPRQDVEIAFEPISLRISLVYATLQYRISITATEDRPAGHLLGDMISAHASLSQEDQLAPPLDVLAPLREVPALRAGETKVLTGEIQLPLNAIRPLQRGNANFLVPLVRLVLIGTGDNGPALRRVFTVGQAGATALAPIRIDTGSRTVDGLAAREIEAARGLPVEPAPARRVAG